MLPSSTVKCKLQDHSNGLTPVNACSKEVLNLPKRISHQSHSSSSFPLKVSKSFMTKNTMGSHMSSTAELNARNRMEVKNKLAQDVRKLTFAASKLRIHKRKDKVGQSGNKDAEKTAKESFKTPPASERVEDHPKTTVPAVDETRTAASSTEQVTTQSSRSSISSRPPPLPSKGSKGIPHRIVACSTRAQKKWTLTDLLHNFGLFVQKKCSRISNAPSASEVAMWVRCADRALQLNGWTINSFLLESHIVFSYMLIACALEKYEVKTLADVKELVLLCLYVSYTYNANEISYPLRPFLVRQDRAAFWDKCLDISLGASGMMLRLNKDHKYYADTLTSLKCIHTFC